jgi:hypothetical protein
MRAKRLAIPDGSRREEAPTKHLGDIFLQHRLYVFLAFSILCAGTPSQTELSARFSCSDVTKTLENRTVGTLR